MPQKKMGEVVVKAARETGMHQKDIQRCTEAVMNSVVYTTKRYGSSNLLGLLNFKLKKKRKVHGGNWKNPATGVESILPELAEQKEAFTVFVQPTAKLKALINDCNAGAEPAA